MSIIKVGDLAILRKNFIRVQLIDPDSPIINWIPSKMPTVNPGDVVVILSCEMRGKRATKVEHLNEYSSTDWNMWCEVLHSKSSITGWLRSDWISTVTK
jgi:hypothetical protein